MDDPALAAYVCWLRASGASAQTVRLRSHYIGRCRAHCDERPLLDLSLDDLIGFLGRAGWSPETRKSARGAVRGFYRWARDTDRIAADPSRLLPPIRVPAGRPRPAPDDVYLRAMSAAGPAARLMVMLAALAGLRRGEIARVHTADVLGDVLRVVGKGGRVRHVPLHPVLLAQLVASPPGYVFPGRDGHLSPGHVGVTLKRLLGEGWSAHTLRHRFASRAYAAERDIRALQTLLGHSKPETTARYTAVPDGALLAAVLAAGRTVDDRPIPTASPPEYVPAP